MGGEKWLEFWTHARVKSRKPQKCEIFSKKLYPNNESKLIAIHNQTDDKREKHTMCFFISRGFNLDDKHDAKQ